MKWLEMVGVGWEEECESGREKVVGGGSGVAEFIRGRQKRERN